MRVSIVLPTYCERENIVDLLEAIEDILVRESWETQIVVVDDNSPDGTAAVVQDHMDKLQAAWKPADPELPSRPVLEVCCYVRTQERGLATAIQYGLLKAKGDILVVMDTDFNHDPAMIPQMVKFLEFYDLVVGSRFVMGGGMEDRLRYYSSLVYNLFVRMMLQIQVQDNLSGFFAIRREQLFALDLERIFQGYGEYFIRLLFTSWQHKYRMLEVPVFYILRRHGQSKSRFIAMLRDYTGCVLSLRLRGQ